MSYPAKRIRQREFIIVKCQFSTSSSIKLSPRLDLQVQLSMIGFDCLKKQPGREERGWNYGLHPSFSFTQVYQKYVLYSPCLSYFAYKMGIKVISLSSSLYMKVYCKLVGSIELTILLYIKFIKIKQYYLDLKEKYIIPNRSNFIFLHRQLSQGQVNKYFLNYQLMIQLSS